mmetsp:Transcript_44375/g.117269  ORF Transcript_44375/g.117269 Transcript_44375/m.117269 type:complete len:240 (+) Transcript_44375:66-785(+)
MRLLQVGVASATLLRRADPFDCYNEETKGEDYKGLHKQTKSGRMCIKWPSNPDLFTFCRNPAQEKGKPFCYYADGETEECAVPKCGASAEAPEKWVAPEGAVTYKKPCEPSKEKKPVYKLWHEGKACRPTAEISEGQEVKQSSKGVSMSAKVTDKTKRGKIWMAHLGQSDDADGCMAVCQSTPGSKYMTFWEAATGAPASLYGGDEEGNSKGNCGCFYECVELDPKLTTGKPSSYRRLY